MVAISACYLGVVLSKRIDKFLGLSGALLCAPLSLLFPAMVHLTHLAKTKAQKLGDLAIFGMGLFVFVFSTG